MVQVYETEQEQIDAIKDWLKENGAGIVLGAVIGLVGVGGYTIWKKQHNEMLEEASLQYTTLMQSADDKHYDQVLAKANNIVDEFESTHYASLSQLNAASAYVAQKDLENAASRLQWVVLNGSTDNFKNIARLRLASIHLANGDTAKAKSTLDSKFPSSYDARLNELLGDIAVKEGDNAAAIVAYDKALGAENPSSNAQLLKIKRDNLGSL